MLLHHGTTRQHAESIIQNGPDANFREPGGVTDDGFSACVPLDPFPFGSPKDYARGKAALFPREGGPAIVAFEIPDDLIDAVVGKPGHLVPGKALNTSSEIRFEPGGGLEQLVAEWQTLNKWIIVV